MPILSLAHNIFQCIECTIQSTCPTSSLQFVTGVVPNVNMTQANTGWNINYYTWTQLGVANSMVFHV